MLRPPTPVARLRIVVAALGESIEADARMNLLFDHGLSSGSAMLLFVCLAIALGFEFVNGFHDTANAVATVIYTNTLRPWVAVVWSAFWTFLGVMAGGRGRLGLPLTIFHATLHAASSPKVVCT